MHILHKSVAFVDLIHETKRMNIALLRVLVTRGHASKREDEFNSARHVFIIQFYNKCACLIFASKCLLIVGILLIALCNIIIARKKILLKI